MHTHSNLPPAEISALQSNECNRNLDLDRINEAHKLLGKICQSFGTKWLSNPITKSACKLKTMSIQYASNCTQYTCINLYKFVSQNTLKRENHNRHTSQTNNLCPATCQKDQNLAPATTPIASMRTLGENVLPASQPMKRTCLPSTMAKH